MPVLKQENRHSSAVMSYSPLFFLSDLTWERTSKKKQSKSRSKNLPPVLPRDADLRSFCQTCRFQRPNSNKAAALSFRNDDASAPPATSTAMGCDSTHLATADGPARQSARFVGSAARRLA